MTVPPRSFNTSPISPDEPAKPVLVEQSEGRMRLRCPHAGCHAFDSVLEETITTFRPAAVSLEGTTVHWRSGEPNHHQHLRYMCAACDRTVLLTEAVRL